MRKLAIPCTPPSRGLVTARTACQVWAPLLAALVTSLSGADTPAPANDATEVRATPRIEFVELVHDFGEIREGDVVKHKFVFSNTGSGTLEITRVSTSCGCTTATEWDRVIGPREKGTIPVEFDSRTISGNVMQTVTVISTDPERGTVTLQLKGSIWAPIKLSPRSVVFQYDAMSPTGETKVVKIVNNLKEPLVLSDPEWKQTAFRAELEEVTAGKEYALRITTVPPVGRGTISAPITLRTSLTNHPRLSVHALAVERQPFTVSPSRILLPAKPLSAPNRPAVTIRNLSADSLSLSEATINVPGVKVELEEVEPGRLFRLTPTFPQGFVLRSTPPVKLSLKTSHPRRPVVQIPVAPRVAGRAVTRIAPPATVNRGQQPH